MIRVNDTPIRQVELGLLGDLRRRRALQLGWEGPEQALELLQTGVGLVLVEPSPQAVTSARRFCEAEEMKIDLHQADVSDLAFLRADSIDVVLASSALAHVEDLRRLFRQVNRVLHPGGNFSVRVTHPLSAAIEHSSEPPSLRRSYFDGTADAPSGRSWTVEEIFTGLSRSGFEIDSLLELVDPEISGPSQRFYPDVLLIRAKKKGA
jgi:SAM-dependent methyltransferase